LSHKYEFTQSSGYARGGRGGFDGVEAGFTVEGFLGGTAGREVFPAVGAAEEDRFVEGVESCFRFGATGTGLFAGVGPFAGTGPVAGTGTVVGGVEFFVLATGGMIIDLDIPVDFMARGDCAGTGTFADAGTGTAVVDGLLEAGGGLGGRWGELWGGGYCDVGSVGLLYSSQKFDGNFSNISTYLGLIVLLFISSVVTAPTHQ
jgi:hypothetical protein